VRTQAPEPPEGRVLVKACPALSTATHSDVDAQDTEEIVMPASIDALVHSGLAAAGSVDTIARPLLSTATHSSREGQETATSEPPASAL
jgi:hypothetical protein